LKYFLFFNVKKTIKKKKNKKMGRFLNFIKENKLLVLAILVSLFYILLLVFGAYRAFKNHQKRRKLLESGVRLNGCGSCTDKLPENKNLIENRGQALAMLVESLQVKQDEITSEQKEQDEKTSEQKEQDEKTSEQKEQDEILIENDEIKDEKTSEQKEQDEIQVENNEITNETCVELCTRENHADLIPVDTSSNLEKVIHHVVFSDVIEEDENILRIGIIDFEKLFSANSEMGKVD